MDGNKQEMITKRKPIPIDDLQVNRARLNKRFRNVLRKALVELSSEGFTQKALSELTGMDEGLISRRLNGKAKMTVDALSDLTRALEIDVSLESKSYQEIERQMVPEVFVMQPDDIRHLHSSNTIALIANSLTGKTVIAGSGLTLVRSADESPRRLAPDDWLAQIKAKGNYAVPFPFMESAEASAKAS